MAYIRCQCHRSTGEVPHDAAAQHTRKHSRCTRAATVGLRRTVTVDGRKNTCPAWFEYCASCGAAIEAYQGNQVERRA